MPNNKPKITTINLDGKDYLISLDLTNSEVRDDLVAILTVMTAASKKNEGLLSKEDKQHLDTLYSSLIGSSEAPDSEVVDTLKEVLDLLHNFPESQDLKALLDEINNTISNLDVAQIGDDGKYIKFVSQENGQLAATAENFDTSITANSDNTNAPTSKAVYTAITDAVNALDVSDITTNLSKGKTITALSETNGKISATAENILITSAQISDKTDSYNDAGTVVVTGKAVKAALETLDITDITNTAGKTVAKITETDGKVGATFQDISITSSQINDKTNSYSETGEVVVTGKSIKAAIDGLTDTLTGTPGTGKTITAFNEVGGKVSATFSDISILSSQISNKAGTTYDPTSSANKSKVATSETIKAALETLDVSEAGEDGSYLKKIKEDDGKITATTQTFDTSIDDNSTDNNAPTSKAVKGYVDTYGGKIDKIQINDIEQTITNKTVNLPAYPTKSSLGLGNVNNTSDLNKPISTATQTALDAKADNSDVVHNTGNETIDGRKTFNEEILSLNGITARYEDDTKEYGASYNPEYILTFTYPKEGSSVEFKESYFMLPDKSSGDWDLATTDDISIAIANNTPANQATTTVVADALTNLNGRNLSNYTATLVTSDYTYYDITYGSSKCTEAQARNYMEYMTGSRYLPVYDYEKPKNSIFMFADRSLWKPQYDTNGLRLYKLSPEIATLDDIQTISGADNFVQLGSASSSIAQTIYGAKTFKDSDLTFINGPDSSYDWETVRIINSYTNPELKLTLGGGAGGSTEYTASSIKKTVPGGSSGDTVYTLSIPNKTGTLATTSNLGAYSVSAGQLTNLSNIDNGGLYHMYIIVKNTGSGGYTNINNYADVGTIRLWVHSYSLNTDPDKYQFLGSTKCAYGSSFDTYYFYAMWSSATQFTIHGRTSITDANPGNTNTFSGEIWLIKICN